MIPSYTITPIISRRWEKKIVKTYSINTSLSKLSTCDPYWMKAQSYNMTVIWHMSYHHLLSFTSYMAYMTLTYAIWWSYWMSILVSKEALESQECSPSSQNVSTIVFRGKNWKIHWHNNFFVFFSFLYFKFPFFTTKINSGDSLRYWAAFQGS